MSTRSIMFYYVLGSGQIIPDPTRPKSPRSHRIWIQISYGSYFKKDRVPSLSEFLSECMRVQQNNADAQNCERLSFSLYCWSGSTWIRIHMAVLDPGAWKWPKFTNKLGFLPYKKASVPSYVCFLAYYNLYVNFSCKNSAFCDFQVWPGSGFG